MLTNPSDIFRSNYWLTTILMDPRVYKSHPIEMVEVLEEGHIETRLLWNPLRQQLVFKGCPFYEEGIAEGLFARGLCFPSGFGGCEDDLERVVESLARVLGLD